MAYNPTKTREWKDGATPATGTPALGSLFNAEFDQLYENDNNLQGDVINEDTPGAGVTVDGVLLKDNAITKAGGLGISEVNGAILRTKIIEIGDWNMDTTASVSIPHGLTASKIRSVYAFVIIDTSNLFYPLNMSVAGSGSLLGWFAWSATEIVLERLAGGFFDSNLFDATSFNRGFITIEYID